MPEPISVTVMSGTGNGQHDVIVPGLDNNNISVNYISPLVGIIIKTTKAFIGSILGLLTTGTMVHDLIPAHDFMSLLAKCASLSAGVAVVATLGSIVAFLGDLEKKFPTLGA